MSSPTVFIVTWCKSEDTYYGNSLVFESIRTGFPTAKIVVLDNCSAPDMRARLGVLAREVGAEFIPLQRELHHWQILDWIALIEPVGADQICFVDPDIIFWEKVEAWQFGSALIAGRLIPAFQDEYTRSATMPRLHTSFLWLPQLQRLRERVRQIRGPHFEFEPFRPSMVPMMGEWLRWDASAALYGVLCEESHEFSERELNAYDHLFCGTHAAVVRDSIDNPRYRQIHEDVQSGVRSGLRGIWREQESHFNSRPIKNPAIRGAQLASITRAKITEKA
ncbi:MAG TPA: hypothetical protein VHV32_18910 [Candidatus Angelobacter sp.]|jgi:hypothetical protein|nr:hypothetical protein [Candidatus Angelobacter sp.]